MLKYLNITKDRNFLHAVLSLAIPVALQFMLQASFSIIDQIMIGQMGSVEVAAVGLAAKFASIFSVVVSAIGAVAGIMISQYLGQNNPGEIRRSFWVNMVAALVLAASFTLLCLGQSRTIMSLYTEDPDTLAVAADYLLLISGTFLPMGIATMGSTMLRCVEKAVLPLIATILSAVVNTVLNYVLIFGKFGFAPMYVEGAAVATLMAQWVNCLMILAMLVKTGAVPGRRAVAGWEKTPFQWAQYGAMILPMLLCEVIWSVGENVYAAIYGHIGTGPSAAMMLMNPIQTMMIGALCGVSQAAGVIIGKKLGTGEYEDAYESSIKLVLWGAIAAVLLSVVVVLIGPWYVQIYKVEESVKELTCQILIAYALVAPFKVSNMIMSGGVIRSGGKTKYVLYLDLLGTWGIGVPMGLVAAFWWHLSIPYVYFLLSLEECVRFGLSVIIFRRRNWMQTLKA